MSKSDCCKAIVYIYSGGEGTHYYVCSECDRACDVMREETMSKSDCCGADQVIREMWMSEMTLCSECAEPCCDLPKLTPAQVKAIRWPSTEEMERYSNMITSSFPYRRYFRAGVDWAVEHALQDLMEREK